MAYTIEERICEISDYAELAEIIDLCEVKISNMLHEEAWHRMRRELEAHREFVGMADRRKVFAQNAGWRWQENHGYQSDQPRNAVIRCCGFSYPNVKGWWMSRFYCPDCGEEWPLCECGSCPECNQLWFECECTCAECGEPSAVCACL